MRVWGCSYTLLPVVRLSACLEGRSRGVPLHANTTTTTPPALRGSEERESSTSSRLIVLPNETIGQTSEVHLLYYFERMGGE